ncbi:MAG: ABC transporter ATP-binding protein [Gammaproteobacteria bacterium]|nr:ABC transporter ATP-binding protein [Gammaproteobacteria bacterium]
MIKIGDLRFSYDQGDFSREIPELKVTHGETVAIVGPCGSGKTTLLNLIAGIATPQSGQVTTNDCEISGLHDAARRDFRISNIGLVFQEFELLEYLNVLDNILLPYRINRTLQLGISVRERDETIAQRVGIGDKHDRYANQLSQGEKQRVAVIRALVVQPPLLLADEPTGNLDPLNKDRVLDILFQYVNDNAATLIAVTHDHDILHRFQRVIDFKDFYGHTTQQHVEGVAGPL